MKSGWSKWILGIAVLMVVFMVSGIQVQAATANVAISSAGGTKGDTVTVTVTVSTDVAAMGQIGIEYDTNHLGYVNDGTNGGVAGNILSILDDIPAGETKTIDLNFVLKEPGTTTISVAANTMFLAVNPSGQEGDNIDNLNTSNGTITINASDTASNNSRLDGLIVSGITQTGASQNVNFTPAFSSEIYDYTATVSSNISRLVVSTTLSDTKATTQVSGTKIETGDNKTTIIVTAEDGSQSTYTLYITKESENQMSTTGQVNQDPNQPQESQSQTESQSETTSETQTELDRTPKLVEAIGKYIIQDFSLVTKPEGYEESIAGYNGQNIAVLKGIAKKITLVCIADDPEGTNAILCIYNEATGAIDRLVNIKTDQKEYTIIPTDDSYQGPKDYIQTTLEIDGESIKAWIREEGTEFYVVYAMNWEGETALYVYDTKEKTLQRYVEGIKTIEVEEEPETENTEYLSMKRQYNELNEEYQNVKDKKNKLIKCLVVALVILVIFTLIAIYKYLTEKEKNMYDNSSDDEDNTSKSEIGDDSSLKYPLSQTEILSKENSVREDRIRRDLSDDSSVGVNEADTKNIADYQTVANIENGTGKVNEGGLNSVDISEQNMPSEEEKQNIEDLLFGLGDFDDDKQ